LDEARESAPDGADASVEDTIPPYRQDTPAVSKVGDLWLLGRHKLICGDARDGGAYDLLMGDDVVDLICTDPPFNVPIDGHVCYRVVLTPKDGQPETRYYDKKSFLLVRTNMIMKNEMGEIPAESTVSDYRTVDGVLVPFLVKQKVLGQEFTITLQSVKTNVEIPKDRFAVPDEVQALVGR